MCLAKQMITLASASLQSIHSKPADLYPAHGGPLGSVKAVQVCHPRVQCTMHLLFQQMPFQAGIVRPPLHCPNSSPMNSSFLAGCAYM